MSGICAVFHRDGRPVDVQLIRRMTARLAPYGPDGSSLWLKGPAAIGYRAFHTTPEAKRETQPNLDTSTGLVIACDGRIDDRAALARGLGVPASGDPQLSDVDLIRMCWIRFGSSFPRVVLGDYAVCLWEPEPRRLVLARDPFGVRPLYVKADARTVLVASTLGAIRAAMDQEPDINRSFLIDFLEGDYRPATTETALAGIRRVRPGSVLSISEEALEEERSGALDGHDAADTAGCGPKVFHARFRESVLDRARSCTPLAVEVSGGLDSSSVFCELYVDRDRLRGPAASVYGFSLQSSSHPEANETAYLDEVSARCPGFPITTLPFDELWAFRSHVEGRSTVCEEPALINVSDATLALYRAASGSGARVLFSGMGGDQLLYSWPMTRASTFLPLARAGTLREVPGLLRHYNAASRAFWKSGILAPLLTGATGAPGRFVARHLQKSFVRSNRDGSFLSGAAWRERAEKHRALTVGALTTGEHVVSDLVNGYFQILLANLHEQSQRNGLEIRYPYLDRRLVQLVAASQARDLFHDGWDRLLQREGLKGILPDSVRLRWDKGTSQPLLTYGLAQGGADWIKGLVRGSRCVALDLVDPARLQRHLDAFPTHTDTHWSKLKAWLECEIWLRSRLPC